MNIYSVVPTFGTKKKKKIETHGKKLVHNWNLILNLKDNYNVVLA